VCALGCDAGQLDGAGFIEMIHDAEKPAAANDDAVAYASVNEDFHAAIYADRGNNTLQYQCT
jgi:DNA-binding GntR family transcriptional regulator